MKGKVLAICICPNMGEQMQQVTSEIEVIAGSGIVGDRYQLGKGAFSKSKRPTIRHISLIAVEDIDDANDEFLTFFTHADTRRNILTQGIDLNKLVGVEFKIGDIIVRGIELCDPCDRPSKLSGKPMFKEAFDNRGGLRVEVLEGGFIAVGTEIVVE